MSIHHKEQFGDTIQLSDRHWYRKDLGSTESYRAGSRERFYAGERAYICNNVQGRPRGEIQIVDSPHVLDYSGLFVYRRVR